MNPADRRFVQIADALREPNAWTNNEWLCRPDLVAAEKLLLVRANMDPMHCHPFHFHPHREEIIHVVYGRAEQWVGTERRILGPGKHPKHRARPAARRLLRGKLWFQGIACLIGQIACDPEPFCPRLVEFGQKFRNLGPRLRHQHGLRSPEQGWTAPGAVFNQNLFLTLWRSRLHAP